MFLFPVVDSNNANVLYVPSGKDQIRPVKADEKIAWMVVINRKPIIEIFLNQKDEEAWVRRSISTELALEEIEMCPLGKLVRTGVQLNARTRARFKDTTPEKELDGAIELIVRTALRQIQVEWRAGFPRGKNQVIVAPPWTGFKDWKPKFSEKELTHMDVGDRVELTQMDVGDRVELTQMDVGDWVEVNAETPGGDLPKPSALSSFLHKARFNLQQVFAASN